jgi:D-erythronate 2-dehydrogenase
MVDGLGRVAGPAPVKRIRWEPDAHIQRIVAGWPYKFETARAAAMGFTPDKSFDEIVSQHIADQLGGKWAA